MILNAYAVLDLFFCTLRLLAGTLLLALGFASLRSICRSTSSNQQIIDERGHLLSLLTFLVLVLGVVSWPLFYLLLQSYVGQWPDVMCIYGVLHIGQGSLGSRRFLPSLLMALQLVKPALVFVTGGWLVLYLINRQTPTASLHGRVLAFVIAAGALAAADAGCEGAYLAIPKKADYLSSGCCTVASEPSSDDSGPRAICPDWAEPFVPEAYLTANIGMIYLLIRPSGKFNHPLSARRLALIALAGMATALITMLFVIDIAAPVLLHQPDHHCPYDLASMAPLSILALAAVALGAFSAAWAWVAASIGANEESQSYVAPLVSSLLRLSALAYAASLIIMTAELTYHGYWSISAGAISGKG